jgi:hypothetical protein
MKYELMNECHMNFASSFKFICWICFQCMKHMNYEWTNFAWFPLLSHEMLSLWCKYHFKQGCKAQKPTDQFEANWTLNWTLFTLKKLFPKVLWMCLKARGSIWGTDIKNVWLTCERIRIRFFSPPFIFHYYYYY